MGGWVERRGEDWLEMLILTPQDMICKIVAFCQNTVCCQPNVHHYEPSHVPFPAALNSSASALDIFLCCVMRRDIGVGL